MENEKLIEIYTFTSLFEAEAIKNILEENGIQTLIRSFEDSAYNGIYKLTKGMGRLLVPEKDLEKTKTIINEFLDKNISKRKDPELETWEKQLYKKSKNLSFIVFICAELLMAFLFYLGLRCILIINNPYLGAGFILVSIIFGCLIFLSWKGYKSKIS